MQRKFAVQFAANHFIGHLFNQCAFPGGQAAGFCVDDRRRFFDIAIGVVDLLGHFVVADIEVLQAALRLGTPVVVGRHIHLAQAVELLTQAGGRQPNRKIKNLGRVCLCHRGFL